jgi:hypothetical protein
MNGRRGEERVGGVERGVRVADDMGKTWMAGGGSISGENDGELCGHFIVKEQGFVNFTGSLTF